MEQQKNTDSQSQQPLRATETENFEIQEILDVDGVEKLFEQEDSVNVFDDDYYYDCIEVTPETLRKLPVEDEVDCQQQLSDTRFLQLQAFAAWQGA